MKICTKCDTEKENSEFRTRCKITGKLYSICRKCQSRLFSSWYEKNKQRHKTNVLEKRKIKFMELSEYIKKEKSNPCVDCGVSYPDYVMDFDHLNPAEKEFEISIAKSKAISLPRIIKEIKKCELVCSNCHRIRTHKRRLSRFES